MTTKTFVKHIKVTWDFIGFHAYADAPAQVEFLRQRHRHKFKCSAKIQVNHNERDLEFFMVQSMLKEHFCDGNMDNQSCESIAERICFFIMNCYPNRSAEVEVSEDGENSSIVSMTCE